MTTHLEYGSQNQRYAQVNAFLIIKDDIDQLSLNPATVQEPGPYAKLERSNKLILCGDFNFESNSRNMTFLQIIVITRRLLLTHGVTKSKYEACTNLWNF